MTPGGAGIERLLIQGFVLSSILWIGASALVLLGRVLYDRRQRILIDISRALTDPAIAALPPLERSPRIRRHLSRLSRRAVYRMMAETNYPIWVSEVCAAYSVEYIGLAQMARDAAPRRRNNKWRRISALFAIGYLRTDDAHTLLAAALADDDGDVASAAAIILQRLGDRESARILIDALHEGGSIPASRIATQLNQFPIPVDDLLRPLLEAPSDAARYWSASLLCKYPDSDGLAKDIAALQDDVHPPVRKAALVTLADLESEVAIPVARRALADEVDFVRSAAVATLGVHASREADVERRRELASFIIPSLADQSWIVRQSAKQSLVTIGPRAWRQVSALLDSPDAFARNGAAEVLQNMGVIDLGVGVLGGPDGPTGDVATLLSKAFAEGGPRMVEAALARSL